MNAPAVPGGGIQGLSNMAARTSGVHNKIRKYALLYLCTFVPLYLCTFVPLYRCTIALYISVRQIDLWTVERR